MKGRLFTGLGTFLLFTLFVFPVSALADDSVYGWELMTEEERIEHRDNMRNADTREERQQIRNEQHDEMQRRADDKGVTLRGDPNQARSGNGFGSGSGKRMGRGSGGGRR